MASTTEPPEENIPEDPIEAYIYTTLWRNVNEKWRNHEPYQKTHNEKKREISVDEVKETTGIEVFDVLEPYSRYQYLLRALDTDQSKLISGRIGVVPDGKNHLLKTGDNGNPYRNSGYDTLCNRNAALMRIKSTVHVNINKDDYCKFCLNKKKKLVAANKVLKSID